MFSVSADIVVALRVLVEVDAEDVREAYSMAEMYIKEDLEGMLLRDEDDTQVLNMIFGDFVVTECEPNINEDLREY